MPYLENRWAVFDNFFRLLNVSLSSTCCIRKESFILTFSKLCDLPTHTHSHSSHSQSHSQSHTVTLTILLIFTFYNSSLKGKFPQTTMCIGWVESNFRNPSIKDWADLDNPFKRNDYTKFCMSPSLDGILPEYVISQEDNSPLTLYIDFQNFFICRGYQYSFWSNSIINECTIISDLILYMRENSAPVVNSAPDNNWLNKIGFFLLLQ